jgi:hypothetical protein
MAQQPSNTATDRLEVMVNHCSGGFGFSKLAVEEYLRRSSSNVATNEDHSSGSSTTVPLLQDATAATTRAINAYTIARHDPIMVQIVKELGERADGFCAQISLRTIPAQYAFHYSIEADADGAETVVVHYDAYRVHAAKRVLRDTSLNASEKLARIAAVLHATLAE